MSKKITLIIMFLLNITFVFPQGMEPQFIHAPNTMSIARYGDIPISLYTGRANISIPIYEQCVRNLSLGIDLTYDTSGIMVNNLPGWIGHSWTLMAGGTITRSMKGYCDEYDESQFEGIPLSQGVVCYPDWKNYFHCFSMLDEIEYGDGMPDMFYFNFMGKSGKFFLGNDGKWKVSSDENLTVEFDINDQSNYIKPFISCISGTNCEQPKTIKGFTIIDESGNRYVFGSSSGEDEDALEYSISMSTVNAGTKYGKFYANAWHLTHVYDRFDNELYRFSYRRGKFLITSSVCFADKNIGYAFPSLFLNSPSYLHSIKTMGNEKIEFVLDSVNTMTAVDFYKALYDRYSSKYKLLHDLYAIQIGNNISHSLCYLTEPDYTIYHNPENTDKENDPLASMLFYRLKEIRVSIGNELLKIYRLNYCKTDISRLFLDNLQICNADNSIEGAYKFNYYKREMLPKDYLTVMSDHWGYYNGKIPSIPSDKTVNPECTKYGTLTEIEYPTGGMSTVEYRINRYSRYRDAYREMNSMGYSKNAGGLVVSCICNYEDSTKTHQLSQRTYNYQEGELIDAHDTYIMTDNNKAYSYYNGYSYVPLANTFGSHIGYSKVIEESWDGYSRIYEYSNISSYKDESCHKDLLNHKNKGIVGYAGAISGILDPWTERDYKRGKLLSLTTTDYDESKYSRIYYYYRTDSLDMESNYVRGLVDKSVNRYPEKEINTNQISTERTFYKIFYPKYDVIKTIESVRFDDPKSEGIGYKALWVHDTIEYTKKDIAICFQSERGVKCDANIRKCFQKKKKSKGMSQTTKYGYLLDDREAQREHFFPSVSQMIYENEHLTEGYRTIYASFGRHIHPRYKLRYFEHETADTVARYNLYSNKGRLTQFVDEKGVVNNLYWDHCDRIEAHLLNPRGKYANPTFPLEATKGNIDDIFRKYSMGATICVYDHRGNISQIYSSNNQKFCYEYDEGNNLSMILDADGNIINQYKYNYVSKNK